MADFRFKSLVFVLAALLSASCALPIACAHADPVAREIARARFTLDNDNIASWRDTKSGILITLTDSSKKVLADVTQANLNRQVDFYVGTELAASPFVFEVITGGQLSLTLTDRLHAKIVELLPKDKMESAVPAK